MLKYSNNLTLTFEFWEVLRSLKSFGKIWEFWEVLRIFEKVQKSSEKFKVRTSVEIFFYFQPKLSGKSIPEKQTKLG